MLPIVWLVVAGLLTYVVFVSWDWVPYIVGAGLALFTFIWVLVCALWPSKPDRRCPRCGGEGLTKIRRGEPGVQCDLCGFRDETMHVAYLDDW